MQITHYAYEPIKFEIFHTQKNCLSNKEQLFVMFSFHLNLKYTGEICKKETTFSGTP